MGVTTTNRPTRKGDKVFTRNQIEALLAEGRKIVIYNGNVLKLDSWLPFHPGGDLAIQHMVGRDATDEINALHSEEAKTFMTKFIIGRIEGRWTNFIPPIQGGVFCAAKSDVELADASEDSTGESSSVSSAPPTPVFDPADKDTTTRRRKASASSASSVSSIAHAEAPSTSIIFDTRTKSQIQDALLKYPPLDEKTQDMVVQKYRALDARLRAEGLYDCNYSAYGREMIRYTLFLASSLTLLHYGHYFWSAVFMGCLWHQLAFTAHDAGHMGITHNFHLDTCIGIFIANFCGGMSEGWWKRSHNVHHIITNATDHDPDIQHLPFFAISHRFFGSVWSTYHDRIMKYDPFAQFMIKFQHYLYFPILAFARFNLYAQSMIHLCLGLGPKRGSAWWHRWLELIGIIVFWTWFGYGILYLRIPTAKDRLIFLLVSNMVSSPLHVQIVLSHFAMSTADLGPHESFPQRMLRTTMDVDCPPWLDFFHGGLQFQAIHHLYPRMPRHNLRKAQKLVREFCADVEIPYSIYGFYDGNKRVISLLSDVAQQARYLEECRKVCAEKGVFSDHHL